MLARGAVGAVVSQPLSITSCSCVLAAAGVSLPFNRSSSKPMIWVKLATWALLAVGARGDVVADALATDRDHDLFRDIRVVQQGGVGLLGVPLVDHHLHCSFSGPASLTRRISRVSTGRTLPPVPGSWVKVLKNRVPTGKSQFLAGGPGRVDLLALGDHGIADLAEAVAPQGVTAARTGRRAGGPCVMSGRAVNRPVLGQLGGQRRQGVDEQTHAARRASVAAGLGGAGLG
jgi:hypothetical protein